MSEEVLVRAENVSKKFCRTLKRSLWYGVQDVVGEVAGLQGGRDDLRPGEFWSVNDVSFELKRGECLGLIGPNGAGKSTLLKILNGLIKPDLGRITLRGRVGALIELGAGFNPILTGRENIYINGAVLGFSKEEIGRKFDAIVEFSEIGEFLDSPVQSYSSGMRVRLGFAVAAQLEPDILLIDEVLAVGDVGFRLKCFNKIAELIANTAVIFVSHSMPQVSRIASQMLVLDNGKVGYCGVDVAEGVSKYLGAFAENNFKIFGDGVDLRFFCIHTDKNVEKNNCLVVNYLDDLHFEFDFAFNAFFEAFDVVIGIVDQESQGVAVISAEFEETKNNYQHRITGKIPSLMLSSGLYSINLSFHEIDKERKTRKKIISSFMAIKDLQVINSKSTAYVPFELVADWSECE